MKVAEVNQQSDFLHSFILLSVYKIGILVGVSWIIMDQIYSKGKYKVSSLSSTKSGVITSVSLGLHFITYMFIAIVSHFRISYRILKVCIGVFIFQYIL